MSSADLQVFGGVVVASDIEEAVVTTLKKWYPTYLAMMARKMQIDWDLLPAPRNYTNRNNFEGESGEEIPKVVVIAPGLMAPPSQYGQGQYRAIWRLGVGVATAGKDEKIANKLTKAYGAATRMILVQKQALESPPGINIAEVTWTEESYADMPIPNKIQLYKSASLFFGVDVENVVNKWKGPETPITTEPLPYPTVETVDIELDLEVSGKGVSS